MTQPKATEAEPDAPTKSKGRTFQGLPDTSDMTRDQMIARLAADGLLGNACTFASFGAPTFGELSLTDCTAALKETAHGLNGGDMSAAVTMLAAQALALNAIFGELARVGKANIFKAPEFADRYLRLAFKAQGQSRATLETLAAIKNPPVVFARQANINNGGQQQVNNGPAPADADQYAQARGREGFVKHSAHGTERSAQAPASARRGKTVSVPNELLEDRTHGSPTMDTRATAGAGRTNQGLEPVGAVNRAAKP
jgi:hypothetical protein